MAKDIKPSEMQINAVFEAMVSSYHLFSAENPKVILVSGVSGSGKSTCISHLIEKQAINFFPIQADDYRKLHPKLAEYREKYGEGEAHKKTGNFAHRFATDLLNKATEKRLNVIYETTFGNLDTANELLNYFKECRYQIIVIALPANIELSVLRNIKRYEEKKNAHNTLPRIVERAVIERMAENYQQCISQLKNDRLISLYEVSDSKMALSVLSKIR